jgi:DNA-binding GntR family transcriptional regulator
MIAMEEYHSLSKHIAAQTRSVRDVVYEQLKDSILNGELKPGQHLRERELAQLFAISTTPLKEALRRLEQEGLVTTVARKGTYVSSEIMSSVEEIHWARSALEGVVARLAAIKITEEEAAALTAQVEAMRVATLKNNTEKAMVLNEQFHVLIRIAAKNNYLTQQIQALHSYDRSFRKKALVHADELKRAFQEHELIFKQIMSRNADGAEQAMIAHIRRTIQFVKQIHGQGDVET